MEEIISYLLAAVVAILAGDRVYQGFRSRHSSPNPGTLREDMKAVREDIRAVRSEVVAMNKTLISLGTTMAEHLGYHRGVREG